MWILSGNEKSPGTTHHLLCNRDILVGRRTDIRLEDDKSISRTHACIHITYLPEDMLSPSARGKVTLSDRSKYGTSVDGQRMDGVRTVGDGSVITFGLQWNTWTLHWRPLTVVTSLVPRSDRDALHTLLTELGGTLLTEWAPAVDFLVMNSFKMSVKAVQALASGTAVVTPQYLQECMTCWRVSPAAPAVSPADFQPPFDEPTLNGSDYDIGVLPPRRTLFFGKRFVFAEESQLQRMRVAIELAGGSPVLLSSCGMTPSEMTDQGVIVMHTELKSPEVNKLKAVLKRAKRRMVQDQEVGLAVLRNSTERDCNPAFDYKAAFLPPLASTQSQSVIGTVLAKETQPPDQPTTGVTPGTSLTPAAGTGRQTRHVVPPTPSTPGTSLTPAAGTGRQTRHVVPPTPSTPGASLTPAVGAGGVIPPTPSTPGTSLTPAAGTGQQNRHVVPPTPSTPGTSLTPAQGAGGVVPPTPSTPGASLTPHHASSRASRSSPQRPAASPPTAASSASTASPADAAEGPPRPARSESGDGVRRPSEDEWTARPESKRARREADSGSVTQSLVLDTQDLLSGSVAGRRLRDPAVEEPQPAFKRPRLSDGGRTRPAATAAADADDLFEFDLESASRPPPPPPKTEVKREPSPIPETPPSREPGPSSVREAPRRPVKRELEADGDWMSSFHRAAARAPSLEQPKPPKLEQVSLAEDGDTSSLVTSCMRLQISALVCPSRPTRDTSAADTSAAGPNFKRFRRAHQLAVCPRIIGGTDLFVGTKRRSAFTNGHAPADDEDDLRAEARRQEEDDEELFRLLDGVGRAGGRRRR